MNNKIGIIIISAVFLLITSSSVGTNKGNEYFSGSFKELPPPPGTSYYTTFNTFKNDVILPKNYRTRQFQILTGQSGPYPDQTAMFMVGKISVSMIFLESNGAIDPSTEDWSNARIADYTNRIKAGLEWLKSQQPQANINWVYHSQKIQTSYEPISRPQDTGEPLWINEAMDTLGIPAGEYHQRVTTYNNNLRVADKTHWAYTIFIVDSYNDWDGMFANNVADYMAGPYIVMTYDNGGWGVGWTDEAAAHETAHGFGAEDEYHIQGTEYCACLGPNGEKFGFLQVPNSNCVSGCTYKGGYPGCGNCDACYTSNCLMENLNSCLTTSSKYQLGWRDADSDGILDAIDTTYNFWTDKDNDKVVDYLDNCPNVPNSNQSDADKDWIGDACDPPVVNLFSPINTSYTTSSIPLTFSVDKPTSSCKYSLDGGAYVTISGCSSTTLSVDSYGSHNVIVNVQDTYGNQGFSNKVYFTRSSGGGGGGGGGRPLRI